MKFLKIIVSKNILGISTKHEKKAETGKATEWKNETTRWSKTGRPFPMEGAYQ